MKLSPLDGGRCHPEVIDGVLTNMAASIQSLVVISLLNVLFVFTSLLWYCVIHREVKMSIKAFELVPVIERIKLMSEKAKTQVMMLKHKWWRVWYVSYNSFFYILYFTFNMFQMIAGFKHVKIGCLISKGYFIKKHNSLHIDKCIYLQSNMSGTSRYSLSQVIISVTFWRFFLLKYTYICERSII